MFAVLALSVLALASIGSIGHAEAVQPEEWQRYESASFRMLSNGDDEASSRILLDLERFRRAFSQLAPGIDSSFPVPTQIVAFRDAASYEPFKAGGDGAQGRGARIVGQFLGHRDGNYITLNADPALSGGLGIIIHEYVHHLVTQNLPGVPRWLNEGLAEYYSSFRVDGRHAVIGLPVQRHLRWWRRNRELGVLEVVDQSPDGHGQAAGGAGRYYAVSWGLTHYLLSRPQGAELLAGYLEEAAVHGDRSRALLSVLGISGRELEEELRAHLGADSLPTVSLALDDLGDVAIWRDGPSAAEVLTVLGELAARLGNERQAESFFDLALAHRPESPEALAALGALRDDQGRLEEAGVLYADALELGPSSARSYLRHGRHLLRRVEEARREDRDRARLLALQAKASFQAAAALEPSFGEPQVMLAQVHLFEGLEAADGLAFGERAMKLLPTRTDVVHNQIRLNLKMASVDRAWALCEGRFAVLADAEARDRVRDEIRRAEFLLAAREAVNAGRWDEGIELYDQAIAHTEDVEMRLSMEEQLDRLEERAEQAARSRAGGSR